MYSFSFLNIGYIKIKPIKLQKKKSRTNINRSYYFEIKTLNFIVYDMTLFFFLFL